MNSANCGLFLLQECLIVGHLDWLEKQEDYISSGFLQENYNQVWFLRREFLILFSNYLNDFLFFFPSVRLILFFVRYRYHV
jgi:hypothetical protein